MYFAVSRLYLNGTVIVYRGTERFIRQSESQYNLTCALSNSPTVYSLKISDIFSTVEIGCGIAFQRTKIALHC